MNPHRMLNDENRIRDVQTIKRVDEKGYLYHMDCSWNYYNIPKEFLAMFDAGCSCFIAPNARGENVMYRNYDYGHRFMNNKDNEQTGLNVVVNCSNPRAKYKSVGVADAYWLDFKNGTLVNGAADDGKTDLSAFSILPYICMDGINEKGLALSILALPLETEWTEIEYEKISEYKAPDNDDYILEEQGQVPDRLYLKAKTGTVAINEKDKKAWVGKQEHFVTKFTGLPTVVHPMLMRYMLDNCADVNEAVAMAHRFNVKTVVPGSTYHVFITDRSGKSVLLEWKEDEMIVIDINHVTNFFVSREDRFGGGYERDECIEAGLTRYSKCMTEDSGLNILRIVAQDPANGNDRSRTQYSCIYNTNKGTLDVYSFGDFGKKFEFSV